MDELTVAETMFVGLPNRHRVPFRRLDWAAARRGGLRLRGGKKRQKIG
jgi:hypothetical protein